MKKYVINIVKNRIDIKYNERIESKVNLIDAQEYFRKDDIILKSEKL